ncbi:MAG: hypothetical protein HY084_11075 [Gemmatimonadetes bacterium]|nr:hypothetical protein [Gemmatimonadota bacterium]
MSIPRLLDDVAESAAQQLVGWLASRVGPEGREWVDALSAEAHSINGGWRKLRWSVGGIALIWTLKRRSRMKSTAAAWPPFDLRSVIHSNVLMLFGLGCAALVKPRELLEGFGIARAPWAVYGVLRVYAVFALVLAVFLWTARDWLASPGGRGAVRGLAVTYTLGTLFIFGQQWSVWDGRSGVGLMLGFLLLALSYARSGWRTPAAATSAQ